MQIQAAEEVRERLDKEVTTMDKEASESLTIQRNLKDNIRHRDLVEEIKEIKDQIAKLNIAEVEKMKRQFDGQYEALEQQLSAAKSKVTLVCALSV
ncbi:hypothetical protein BT69DRAFT_1280936 [Atractiella rhizophila]|nr:hypothetical protein BT69DRAFT_1280936 [Atractiella rhizophila]